MGTIPEDLTPDQQKNWQTEQTQEENPVDQERDMEILKSREKFLTQKLDLWESKQPDSPVVQETEKELDGVRERITFLEKLN